VRERTCVLGISHEGLLCLDSLAASISQVCFMSSFFLFFILNIGRRFCFKPFPLLSEALKEGVELGRWEDTITLCMFV
jgi:hypothetical protein